jgi:hypothetical protein
MIERQREGEKKFAPKKRSLFKRFEQVVFDILFQFFIFLLVYDHNFFRESFDFFCN